MKPRRKKAAPTAKEWDFSTCLDQERNACLHYEYTREFLRVRSDLKDNFEGKSRAEALLRFLILLMTHGKECSDYFPILASGFPTTPWLELAREERIALRALYDTNSELLAPEKWPLESLQTFAEHRGERFEIWRKEAMQWVETNGYIGGKNVSFFEILRSCPHPPWAPDHLYRYTGHDYALIKLDWRKSNNDLMRSFEKLLGWRQNESEAPTPIKQTAKDVRVPFPRRGGRGGPVDQLRQLSILRLKTYYGNRGDVVEFLEARKSDLPHENVRSIDNGAAKARALLRKMEKDGRFSVFSGARGQKNPTA